MTHEQLENQFILQDLKEGDFIQLTLDNNEIVQGKLSVSKVHPQTIINEEIIGSRIGIFPGPLTVMNTYFSENVLEIRKLKS